MVSTSLSEGLPPSYLHPEPDLGPLPSGWDTISSSVNILPSPLPSLSNKASGQDARIKPV